MANSKGGKGGSDLEKKRKKNAKSKSLKGKSRLGSKGKRTKTSRGNGRGTVKNIRERIFLREKKEGGGQNRPITVALWEVEGTSRGNDSLKIKEGR